MGKTRFAILRPLNNPSAVAPQKNDLLMFSYQQTENVSEVDIKLAENVFLVISEKNNSYIVYWYTTELLKKYNLGLMSGLAQIGTTQDKITLRKRLKVRIWQYGNDFNRVITDIGIVQSSRKLLTAIGTIIHHVTTSTGEYYIMS